MSVIISTKLINVNLSKALDFIERRGDDLTGIEHTCRRVSGPITEGGSSKNLCLLSLSLGIADHGCVGSGDFFLLILVTAH